ncbi:MAG: NapC/NirT family cytochrome c [Gammaproteobacteria bacterium]|nr:NapC/NirT family cytochrome c [Gammaproteobacteria bacterium]
MKKPSKRYATGSLVVMGIVIGVLGWGGFNWGLEMTNTEEFCISCHEMESTVYQELKETIHYTNPSGVRATCPDCHVPRPWIHKIIRKIQASSELYHHFMGTLDTPEKFEAHRRELAQHVWQVMKETDSRECRNCHSTDSMNLMAQSQRARTRHEQATENGETCIDCHKGIAHKDVYKEIQKEKEQEAEPDFGLDL